MTKNIHNTSPSKNGPGPLPKTPISVIGTDTVSPNMDVTVDATAVYGSLAKENMEDITPTSMSHDTSPVRMEGSLLAPAADQPLTPPLTPTMKPSCTPAGSPPSGSTLISLITSTLPSPLRVEAEKFTCAVVAKKDSVMETAMGTVCAVRDTALNRIITVRDQAVNSVGYAKDEAVHTAAYVRDGALSTASGARDSVLTTLCSLPVVQTVVHRAPTVYIWANQSTVKAVECVNEKRDAVYQVVHPMVFLPITSKASQFISSVDYVRATIYEYLWDMWYHFTHALFAVKLMVLDYWTVYMNILSARMANMKLTMLQKANVYSSEVYRWIMITRGSVYLRVVNMKMMVHQLVTTNGLNLYTKMLTKVNQPINTIQSGTIKIKSYVAYVYLVMMKFAADTLTTLKSQVPNVWTKAGGNMMTLEQLCGTTSQSFQYVMSLVESHPLIQRFAVGSRPKLD